MIGVLVSTYQIFLFSFLLFSEVLALNGECGKPEQENGLSFPWNVGIYAENENRLELICFGSIIQSKAVLTAAHCLCENIDKKLRNTTFYVTANIVKDNVSLKAIPADFHKVNKKDIVLNKYYTGLVDLYANDVAIIKGKFQWNNRTKPVCVDWSDEININEISKQKQPIWQNSKVKIIDQSYLDIDECPSSAPKEFIPFITEDKKCTIINDTGIRLNNVNEGAGLVFLNSGDNRWYIKGVVSMHEPSQGKLSTYSTITQNLNWISNICALL